MTMKAVVSKVAGVTFDQRQQIIAALRGDEPCRVVPEPENQYDHNALAVHVATTDGVKHVGYIPRNLAAEIAPHLEGESLMVHLRGVTGGFETEGGPASYGLQIEVQYPDDEDIL